MTENIIKENTATTWEVIAFNLCIRVFKNSQTYISEKAGKKYLHNVAATYANNGRKEYRRLLLKTGKSGKEYVVCFGVRCYVCIDDITVREKSKIMILNGGNYD